MLQAVVCTPLCPAEMPAHLLLPSLAQPAGLAPLLGSYQAASIESFRGGSGHFAALHKDWKSCAGEGTGERSPSQWLLGSGFQVHCFAVCCFSGDVLRPVGASGLVQKVWSVLD